MIKKCLMLIFVFIISLSLFACNNEEVNNDDGPAVDDNGNDNNKQENKDVTYEGSEAKQIAMLQVSNSLSNYFKNMSTLSVDFNAPLELFYYDINGEENKTDLKLKGSLDYIANNNVITKEIFQFELKNIENEILSCNAYISDGEVYSSSKILNSFDKYLYLEEIIKLPNIKLSTNTKIQLACTMLLNELPNPLVEKKSDNSYVSKWHLGNEDVRKLLLKANDLLANNDIDYSFNTSFYTEGIDVSVITINNKFSQIRFSGLISSCDECGMDKFTIDYDCVLNIRFDDINIEFDESKLNAIKTAYNSDEQKEKIKAANIIANSFEKVLNDLYQGNLSANGRINIKEDEKDKNGTFESALNYEFLLDEEGKVSSFRKASLEINTLFDDYNSDILMIMNNGLHYKSIINDDIKYFYNNEYDLNSININKYLSIINNHDLLYYISLFSIDVSHVVVSEDENTIKLIISNNDVQTFLYALEPFSDKLGNIYQTFKDLNTSKCEFTLAFEDGIFKNGGIVTIAHYNNDESEISVSVDILYNSESNYDYGDEILTEIETNYQSNN